MVKIKFSYGVLNYDTVQFGKRLSTFHSNVLSLFLGYNYVHLLNFEIKTITLFITFFFVLKPTRCTNFTNLFCHENLHVSESSSVRHQEFIHCTLSNGICHRGL
jgi:hypothetical protein